MLSPIKPIQDQIKIIKDLILLRKIEAGFVKYVGSRLIDNGIIISDGAGGKLERQFDSRLGVQVEWWGAKGDGITDDWQPITDAIKYCLNNRGSFIWLFNKVYRITKQLIIGYKGADEIDLLNHNPTSSPSYNAGYYGAAAGQYPFQFKGSGHTAIYADFDSDKLTAAIYYSCYGDKRTQLSIEKYSGEISGLGIYAKGCFIDGKPTGMKTWFSEQQNNQAGIAAFSNINLKIDNVTIYGFKEGIIANNSYFSQTSNIYFKACHRPYYTIQSHGCLISNCVAYYCSLPAYMGSSQLVINNYNTEQCQMAMHILGSRTVINGGYYEALYTAGEAQLVIGADEGDKNYEFFNETGGIVINAMTIAGFNNDKSLPTGILFKKSAKSVEFHGLNNASTYTINKSAAVITSTQHRGGFQVRPIKPIT